MLLLLYVFLALFGWRRTKKKEEKGKKKRKRSKKGKEEVLEILNRRLKRKGTVDIEELFELDSKFRTGYGVGIDELLRGERKKKERERREREESESIEIPIDIFKEEKVGASEALTKFLKENLGMKFSEIATVLNRDQGTVWVTYRNSAEKMKGKIVVRKSTAVYVSVSIFADRRLSVLESLVNYLREQGLKNVEIATLLEKDPRNVYTLYSRAVSKLKTKKKEKV